MTDRVSEVGLATARIEAFNGAEKAKRDDRFSNRNAEVWWAMRDFYMDGKLDTEADENLIGQVSSRAYSLDSRGRVKLQSKRELSDSPDEADALAMTFAPLHEKPAFKIWV